MRRVGNKETDARLLLRVPLRFRAFSPRSTPPERLFHLVFSFLQCKLAFTTT
jgi:hypothetical protein